MSLTERSANRYIYISARERMLPIIKGAVIVAVLDRFFYRSLWALIVLIPIGIIYIQYLFSEILDKKRQKIREEFKELLLLSSTGLRAGYSIENAITGSYKDLKDLYGKDAFVCKLICDISVARKNNRSISEVIKKAGSVTDVEEISEFGTVYEIAYKKSGNLSSIMDKTAEDILSGIELEEEIFLMLSDRRFEMKIMNIMPFIIMLYVDITGHGYFDKMYHNPIGIMIMSVFLGIYIGAYVWGIKISNIKI